MEKDPKKTKKKEERKTQNHKSSRWVEAKKYFIKIKIHPNKQNYSQEHLTQFSKQFCKNFEIYEMEIMLNYDAISTIASARINAQFK